MLTTLQDRPSLDTAHTTWCLGTNHAYPLIFYFPMIRGMKKHQHVDHYVAELCEWLQDTFKEAQAESTSEAERQKWYYDRKANASFTGTRPPGLG